MKEVFPFSFISLNLFRDSFIHLATNVIASLSILVASSQLILPQNFVSSTVPFKLLGRERHYDNEMSFPRL